MIEFETPAVAVNPPDETEKLTYDQVWEGLIWKAELPILFIKPILEARVLERFDDGILRDAIHSSMAEGETEMIRERVFYESDGRMVFLRLNSGTRGQVVNTVRRDERGEPTLSFGFTFEYDGIDHGDPEEAKLLEETSRQMEGAVAGTIAAIRGFVTSGQVPTVEMAQEKEREKAEAAGS
jgi:hypothetical protein